MSGGLDVAVLTAWLGRVAVRYAAEQGYLCDLDAAIGDGDHGANLARGFTAVVAKLGQPASPAALFKSVGMTLIGTVGGASGPLYGTLFIDMGKAAGESTTLDAASWAKVLAAGLAGVAARGKAQPGDKTMIDALTPAVQALQGETDLTAALTASAAAAVHGAEATKKLIAHKGRASYLGERAIGHQDPGATSLAMLLQGLASEAG
ncbi:MAG: dihydroxyacetone kinase subunit L [Rhodospirillales bacterium 20-60-12]|nr:MAG: dihydroxyacetone kinase subunit L [Rhodospirillales bacterium 20-60-12]HQT66371.1 dihydroxyacetone kinase subunit DhaL [Acetobacteraceae bacterium]HQU02740.1 dihydroxyacetone kinase subunit DhaL [Acetobacteraceae bacterium]